MPAGVGSLFRLADPFPMVVKRAEGARVWDADDNEYLDFMLGFSTMLLGQCTGRGAGSDQAGAAVWDLTMDNATSTSMSLPGCSATWCRAWIR